MDHGSSQPGNGVTHVKHPPGDNPLWPTAKPLIEKVTVECSTRIIFLADATKSCDLIVMYSDSNLFPHTFLACKFTTGPTEKRNVENQNRFVWRSWVNVNFEDVVIFQDFQLGCSQPVCSRTSLLACLFTRQSLDLLLLRRSILRDVVAVFAESWNWWFYKHAVHE